MVKIPPLAAFPGTKGGLGPYTDTQPRGFPLRLCPGAFSNNNLPVQEAIGCFVGLLGKDRGFEDT